MCPRGQARAIQVLRVMHGKELGTGTGAGGQRPSARAAERLTSRSQRPLFSLRNKTYRFGEAVCGKDGWTYNMPAIHNACVHVPALRAHIDTDVCLWLSATPVYV